FGVKNNGRSGRHPPGPRGAGDSPPPPLLREPYVLAPRALGTLAAIERDGLAFAEIVETGVAARRVVKEVLVSVTGQDDPEALVSHESLDRTVHGCHGKLLQMCERT